MSKRDSDCMDANGQSDVRIQRLGWLFKTAHDLASKLGQGTLPVNITEVQISDPGDTHGRLHFQIESAAADCDDNTVELQLLQQDTGDRMKISIKYIDENLEVPRCK